MRVWPIILEQTSDAGSIAKIMGVEAKMHKYNFLFGKLVYLKMVSINKKKSKKLAQENFIILVILLFFYTYSCQVFLYILQQNIESTGNLCGIGCLTLRFPTLLLSFF